MSRIILSPLHYLAIVALAVPMLGLGYIAGNVDLLAVYRLNLEMSLSGAGADYDGKIADANQPIFPVIAEANDLFDVKGKGPRADLLYRQRIASNTDFEARRRQAARDIENQVASNDIAITNAYPTRQTVNRIRKQDKFPNRELAFVPQRAVKAELPIISQDRVSQLFSLNDKSGFDLGRPEHRFVSRAVIDVPARPKFTGLEVKQTAALGLGNRKFFGGLTENEFRNREKRCLATAIYFEARSEPIKGQLAVAQVIMNRVRSKYYADTVCGVVYEGAHRRNSCQFSFACDGLADKPRDKKRWAIAMRLSNDVTAGKVWLSDIGYASHYHANYVSPKWRRYMTRIKQIGAHIFYRAKYFRETTTVVSS